MVTHTRLGRLARSSNGANSTVRLLGLFVVFCALASPPTVRAVSYWIGGSGLWSDSANWNPNTVPDSYTPPNDRVFIWPSDGINRNIGYLDNANIGGLYIDLTGYTGSTRRPSISMGAIFRSLMRENMSATKGGLFLIKYMVVMQPLT